MAGTGYPKRYPIMNRGINGRTHRGHRRRQARQPRRRSMTSGRRREPASGDRTPAPRGDPDQALALVDHRLPVLGPVGMFPRYRPEVVDERLARAAPTGPPAGGGAPRATAG